MDHASLQGNERDVPRMAQHIAPICGRGGRNLIGCDLESTKSATQKVGDRNANDKKQNCGGKEVSLESSQVAGILRSSHVIRYKPSEPVTIDREALALVLMCNERPLRGISDEPESQQCCRSTPVMRE
jgi:hypothetical protein